jgi:glucose/mannose-6-phosphate isomerase
VSDRRGPAPATHDPRRLDEPGEIARLDPRGVHEILARFPDQCRHATALQLEPAVRLPTPQLVVIAGMGGSAAGGDLLTGCLGDRQTVPIIVHRGYGLPAAAGASTLVIASSYSGETAETLSAFQRAQSLGARPCAVTSGGSLGALAARHQTPTVTLPGGFAPRLALGYLFFPLLRVLHAAGLPTPPAGEVGEALAVLDAMRAELGPAAPSPRNPAKRLAADIGERLPVIYGGSGSAGVAYRWKTDFEENAKRFAVAGALPEMNHNEVEAWRRPAAARFHAILFRDDAEHPDVARRFTVFEAMVGGAAGGMSTVTTRGEGRLARLLSLIYLGQWTSYYLALLGGVDPWTVPMLDEIKRRLAS